MKQIIFAALLLMCPAMAVNAAELSNDTVVIEKVADVVNLDSDDDFWKDKHVMIKSKSQKWDVDPYMYLGFNTMLGAPSEYKFNLWPSFDLGFGLLGEWMRVNGESIYGTRGGIIPPHDWGVTTQRGNTLYVHILNLKDDALYLPLSSSNVKQVRTFADKARLHYTASGRGITIQLPAVPTGLDMILEVTIK